MIPRYCFHNYIPLSIFVVFLMSCNENSVDKQSEKLNAVDSSVERPLTHSKADTLEVSANSDIESENYAYYYLTIADTGQDYFKLRKTMFDINKATHFTIDTEDRYYNFSKKEIVLPDTINDEMYQGEYFPRRETGEHLSLEYFGFYTPNSTEKNIVLLVGIYENKQSADSSVNKIKPFAPYAFEMRARIYEGCMH